MVPVRAALVKAARAGQRAQSVDGRNVSQAPDTLLDMDGFCWSDMTNDQIEQVLTRCEANVGAIRAVQARGLAELDRRQAPTADGCRSLQEWAAGRLDVTRQTASDLVRLTRCTHEDVRADVSAGIVSFDRAVAEVRLMQAGASDEERTRSRGWDVAGVHRLAARRRRLEPVDERLAYEGRYFAMQPNLDYSFVDLRGRLVGIDADSLARAVTRRADELPRPPDGTFSKAQRFADALVSIADDSLATDNHHERSAAGPVATVLVDAGLAADSFGQAGAEVAGGTRIGPDTLAEILCNGRVEIDIAGATPLALGPSASAIPPRLRRFVIGRDGGVCSVAGCSSRYRLQVHHVLPRSHGGGHEPANLACLCWYHHHVVIHGAGYTIDADSPPQRRRLVAPSRAPPAPPG